MKILIFVIVLFYSQLILCQVVFTSPLTEHYPIFELEIINRTITIGAETIIIESETPINTIAKQTFYIQEFSQQEFPNHGLSDFFVCSSKDGLYITYFLIPVAEKVEFIEVVQPQQLTLNARRFRFLVD